MKFEEINKRFTAAAAEWMAKGWHINTGSMGGHQGEIAKLDLTDGTEVIRILLNGTSTEPVRFEDMRYRVPYIALTVGKVTDGVTPNSPNSWPTAWNQNLEVISEERFYRIGERSGWYGTLEDAVTQQVRHEARLEAREVGEDRLIGCRNPAEDEKARRIALAYVRRQPRHRSARLRDVRCVKKTESDGKARYAIVLNSGLSFTLR